MSDIDNERKTLNARVKGLMDVVRLTFEEGFELGPLLTATKQTDVRGMPEHAAGIWTPSQILAHASNQPDVQPEAMMEQVEQKKQQGQHEYEQLSLLQQEQQQLQELVGQQLRQLEHQQQQQPCPPKPAPEPSTEAFAHVPSSSVVGKVLMGGPCESCGCRESPQWRRLEPARMVLCNRCGIHYGRYKKLPGRKLQDSMSVAASAAVDTMKRKSTNTGPDATPNQQRRHWPARVHLRLSEDGTLVRGSHAGGRTHAENAARTAAEAGSRMATGRLVGSQMVQPNAFAAAAQLPPTVGSKQTSSSLLHLPQFLDASARRHSHGSDEYPLRQTGAMAYNGTCFGFNPVRQEVMAELMQHPGLLQQQLHVTHLFLAHQQQQQHLHQLSLPPFSGSGHEASAMDDDDTDGGRGKKFALQRKLQLLFSNGELSHESSRASSYGHVSLPEPEISPIGDQGEPTRDHGQRPPLQPLVHLVGQQQQRPGAHVTAGAELHQSHAQLIHQLETDRPNASHAGPQPAAKEQHYILQHGVLMGPDGVPADAATCHAVIGSLLQQQQQRQDFDYKA